MGGISWCFYEEAPADGSSAWNTCSDSLDFDELKLHQNLIKQELLRDQNKATLQVQLAIKELTKNIQNIEELVKL